MKNLKFIPYAFLLFMSIVLVSCTQEDPIDLNQEILIEETQNTTKSTNKLMIRVSYEFTPGMTTSQKNAMKLNRQNTFSQYFTIYSTRTSTNCESLEYWVVNELEYITFKTGPDKGTNNSDDSDEMAEKPYNPQLNEECPTTQQQERRKPKRRDSNPTHDGQDADGNHH